MTSSVKIMICLNVGLFTDIEIPKKYIKLLDGLKKNTLLEHSNDKTKLLANTNSGPKLMCIDIERLLI